MLPGPLCPLSGVSDCVSFSALLTGFPPLAQPEAHTLILGSMPGSASLDAAKYYAHPRNGFWPIITSLLGLDPTASYAERCAALIAHGYALWDVVHACTRPGSLDADIDAASVVPNDFAGFFQQHPRIRRVFFNGSGAEKLFRRHGLPQVPTTHALRFQRLPSTSPAHASLSLHDKLDAWRVLLP